MGTVAFIGLGNMGLPMALNLVRAGHGVAGFDLSPAARQAAGEGGICVAASAVESVRGADVIITMLPAGRHVLAVWEEIVEAAQPGALLIDSSTIDVESARAAHGLAAAKGLHALDAPVSGGTGGASAGTLTFMCGGSVEAYASGKPVLEAMGTLVNRADSPDDIAACVEATLKFAYNTYRPTATLIGQRVIGAKTFGKD